jgi:hypothetical protein
MAFSVKFSAALSEKICFIKYNKLKKKLTIFLPRLSFPDHEPSRQLQYKDVFSLKDRDYRLIVNKKL